MAAPAEVLLINKEYLVKMTNLSGSVDTDMVTSSIILAQDIHLTPVLGTRLMQAVKEGEYTELLDNYIRKALVWWVFADILGKLYVRVENGGLFMRSAQNGDQITSDEYRMKRNECESNARLYTSMLSDYLSANHNLFPELNQNSFPDKSPQGSPYKRKRIRISGGARVESTRDQDKYL